MKSRVILIFLDGVGIGTRNEMNPLSRFESGPLAIFSDAQTSIDGAEFVATDPRLGVDGRPQSASGQTTILTGINAPKLLGSHKQGFPNQELRELIAENSIFRRINALPGRSATFANAYTPRFFDNPPRWKSATTVAVELSGSRFRTLDDLVAGRAVFHDFTNELLMAAYPEIARVEPRTAAKNLVELTRSHDFVLYEHFITDKIGHAQDMEAAARHLPVLAEFLNAAAAAIDDSTTLILTSDHGNIEDLSVRNHTLNDVPTIIWGQRRVEAASMIRDLADITPAILHLLTT
jgi:hypothetical protein